ncbi:hypothetical protein BH23BAC2_BH23BAC2_03460 [soil metagenome]
MSKDTEIKFVGQPIFKQVINLLGGISINTGNNDMHLKNFSLYKDPSLGYNLSPAYDMLRLNWL